MATVSKPIALDESMHTSESPSRNIADVLAEELSGIASAITGGSDKVPKTDVATVEPSTTASRSYSVGELVYVNGNLYKVIASISQGSAFTVGTNIQSTTVSGALGEGDRGSVSVTADGTKTYSQLLNTLFSLVDSSKINTKSQMLFSTGIIFFISSIATNGTQYDFGSMTVRNVNGIRMKATSSEFTAFNISTSTYTDNSNVIATNGTSITLKY